MMLELLIALTVAEITLALGVLVVYLILIVRSLQASVSYASKLSFGVRAIETMVGHIGPAVTRLNGTLGEIAGALPGIADKAEGLATAGRKARGTPAAPVGGGD